MPVQYGRFCSASGIGLVADSALDPITEEFATNAIDVAEEAEENALNYEVLDLSPDNEINTSIDIITHARNGWRKNARDRNVIRMN